MTATVFPIAVASAPAVIATGILVWPFVVNRRLVARRPALQAVGGVLLIGAGSWTFPGSLGVLTNTALALIVWAWGYLRTQPEAPARSPRWRRAASRFGRVVLAVGTVIVLAIALDVPPAEAGPRVLSMSLTAVGWQLVALMFLPRRQCRRCRGNLRLTPLSTYPAFFCRACWSYSCDRCLHRDKYRCYCPACGRAQVIERMPYPARPTLFTPATRWGFARLNEDFLRDLGVW